MNLAWKEIKFYKFLIYINYANHLLTRSMVLFINGLAQGLAREMCHFKQSKCTNIYY